MAERLAELFAMKQDSPKLEDVEDAEILNYGYLAYRKLWHQFDIPELLNEVKGQLNLKHGSGWLYSFIDRMARHLVQKMKVIIW